jgi:methionyl-tRNA formyltransferase
MRVVFMGTPDFAVQSLSTLIASKHEVVAVFTREDKPRNRGKKIVFSPVKEVALEHGIPVYQPSSVKNNPEIIETLQKYEPDCIAVTAYGMILPQSVLDLPRYGCLNVHASLLPRYRGAAPINRCIMEGELSSGVTIMQMNEGLDTGAMLLTEAVAITEDMTASQLHDILAEVGGRLLVQALNGIDSLEPIEQDDSLATYAEKIMKAECEVDLTKSAQEICNHIRGLADYPCAYTFIGEKRVKVYKAEIGRAEGIELECGNGELITLTEIQPEGKKRMKAIDFLKGNR